LDWFSTRLRASETGILPQSELDAARQDMTPEQYDQEFECSFDAAIMGAYFGREIAEAERQGRICDVPYDPHAKTYTAWDLGKGANMAVWTFQVVGPEVHVIDYLVGMHSDGVPQVAQKLQALPYRYEADFVPHDARATEIGTGRTRVEQMLAVGLKPAVVPDHNVDDGIAAARLTLGRCWFDRTKCADGIEALRQYRSEFDEKARVFKNTPKHDWTSHTADAFRYLCVAWRELAKPAEQKPRHKDLRDMTLDELWASVPRKESIRI
jgi:hypothetical protein